MKGSVNSEFLMLMAMFGVTGHRKEPQVFQFPRTERRPERELNNISDKRKKRKKHNKKRRGY